MSRRPYNVAYRTRQSPGVATAEPVPPGTLRRHRKLWLVLASVVVVLGALFVLRVPIASGLARAWVVDEVPAVSDAIVMLSGGLVSRPESAAGLYVRGYAPKVIGTDVWIEPELVNPSNDFNAAILEKHGVPRDAIVWLPARVTSTFDEAAAVLQWARANRARRIIVTTDPFHTRRAKWVFDRVFRRTEIELVIVASHPREYTVRQWWRSETGLIDFQNEVIKYFYYRWKY